MTKFILIRMVGILGIVLVVGGYYLLWGSTDAEVDEIIRRAKAGILMTLFGNLMIIFYLFKR
jgi:hypothetical protein